MDMNTFHFITANDTVSYISYGCHGYRTSYAGMSDWHNMEGRRNNEPVIMQNGQWKAAEVVTMEIMFMLYYNTCIYLHALNLGLFFIRSGQTSTF